MSLPAAGRILGVGRAALGRCLFRSVRSPTLTSRLSASSKPPPETEEEVNDEPIKFSTSKASHRAWNVERSMGSQYTRPWWKVLPLSLVFISVLLWCAFRDETEIDAQLEKQLYEHLPGFLPNEEESEPPNNSPK